MSNCYAGLHNVVPCRLSLLSVHETDTESFTEITVVGLTLGKKYLRLSLPAILVAVLLLAVHHMHTRARTHHDSVAVVIVFVFGKVTRNLIIICVSE